MRSSKALPMVIRLEKRFPGEMEPKWNLNVWWILILGSQPVSHKNIYVYFILFSWGNWGNWENSIESNVEIGMGMSLSMIHPKGNNSHLIESNIFQLDVYPVHVQKNDQFSTNNIEIYIYIPVWSWNLCQSQKLSFFILLDRMKRITAHGTSSPNMTFKSTVHLI